MWGSASSHFSLQCLPQLCHPEGCLPPRAGRGQAQPSRPEGLPGGPSGRELGVGPAARGGLGSGTLPHKQQVLSEQGCGGASVDLKRDSGYRGPASQRAVPQARGRGAWTSRGKGGAGQVGEQHEQESAARSEQGRWGPVRGLAQSWWPWDRGQCGMELSRVSLRPTLCLNISWHLVCLLA